MKGVAALMKGADSHETCRALIDGEVTDPTEMIVSGAPASRFARWLPLPRFETQRRQRFRPSESGVVGVVLVSGGFEARHHDDPISMPVHEGCPECTRKPRRAMFTLRSTQGFERVSDELSSFRRIYAHSYKIYARRSRSNPDWVTHSSAARLRAVMLDRKDHHESNDHPGSFGCG